MAVHKWFSEAEYVEYCSCDYGCPCESNAPPTYGECTGAVAFKINKGHCDYVNLDGLVVVATFYFPRAIHHGQEHMQPIHEAESATDYAEGVGDIKFDLAQRHSSLAYVAWDRNGSSLDLEQSRERFPLSCLSDGPGSAAPRARPPRPRSPAQTRASKARCSRYGG